MRKEDLDFLRDGFEFHDDDVVLVSYPKCGNHWLKGFLPMLIYNETEMNVVSE